MYNFKVTTTTDGLTVSCEETKSSISLRKQGKVFETLKNSGGENAKESAYMGHAAKFMRDLLNNHNKKNSLKRMQTFLKENSGNIQRWRTLSNSLRRHFDDGSILPQAEFRKTFFYEGIGKGQLQEA
jgi:hypothetical protein